MKMKNIKYAAIAAAVFSSGVLFGAIGFDDAVAANIKTYKTVANGFDEEEDIESILNDMAAKGWELEQMQTGNYHNILIFSK